MKKLLYHFLITGFVLSVVLTSCKKESNKTAPELPPQSSFVMDFSGFSNPDDTVGSRATATYHNWGFAYTNVAVWNTIIKTGLAVPVAAFNESFKHEAIYHPDENNWTWSYNFTAGGVSHEAELTGFIVDDTVNWEMRITKQGAYSNFLWYKGKNSFDRSGGYWILNENPVNPNPLLRIDWTYEGGGIGDIKYTNIKPGAPENGAYINYGTQAGDMNRFYSIYHKVQENMTEIEWDHTDYHGHVKDPKKFADSIWHCWDATLQDVECP